MKMHDVHKVNAAGFKVFKIDVVKKAIYENTGHGSWKLFGKYSTKVETERNWKVLMDHPKCIAG